MKWIIPGILATIAATFAVIYFPAPFIAFVFAGTAFFWLWKQGFWRTSYVAVLLSTLGAISSISIVSAYADYGRVLAVAALLIATYSTTQSKNRRPLLGLQKWVLGFLAVMAVTAVVSTIWSVAIGDTLIQSSLLVALLLILQRLIVSRWVDRSALTGDIRVGVVVGSLYMAAGLAADYAGLLPPAYNGRFQGLFNNPNAAALVAVVVLFMGWGLVQESRSVAGFFLMAPPLLTIALAQSRTAFLAVVVGAAWIALRSGVRALFATTLICAFTAFLTAPLWQPVLSRFGVIAAGDVYAGRTLGWQTALDLLRDRPIGYGWGSTQSAFASAFESGRSVFQPQSIHNSYLQVAFELGWVGFAVMALALSGVIVLILRQRPRGVEAGLSGAIVGGLVIHFSESAMFGTGQPYPWLYWFAVAGLLACMRTQGQPVERLRPKLAASLV